MLKGPCAHFNKRFLSMEFYKNLYGDIPCLDRTRVKLAEPRDGNDYIHANVVVMPQHKCRYILTQAPLPDTIQDFWAMVWQENVSLIVCLTKILERGKTKTQEYWPTCCGKQYHQKYGFVHVRNVGIRNAKQYSISILEIANERTMEKRKLTHYLYLDWPDHRVPICTHNFLQLAEFMDAQLVQYSGKDPMCVIVHCSAGVGRSGTLVALQALMAVVNSGEEPNVLATVTDVRLQRAMSVQGPEQYLFLYYALAVHILLNIKDRKGLLQKIIPLHPSKERIFTDPQMSGCKSSSNLFVLEPRP
ncbi:tyrosine protein phosphatase non receptor type [Trichuris trichiura]|uniref:Tyrosine protein phosphatase non receptor type n=1 Tax=Trichuris trichiura TaxID=36087 RepID=A0A077Z3P2_TRITR|nr:tyrosine protein phosphatase non receptor type [Trichuris trichiura]